MSLVVVSTPIGNVDDITLRGVRSLKGAQAIICEELKPTKILLKRLQIPEPPLYQLNEHSRDKDLPELVSLCKNQNVCLISDCGTPGFCDPGAKLVDACFRERIHVDVNPGPSSLTALIALAGAELKNFYFVGFLPAEKSERGKKIAELAPMKSPLILMDTPYRLQATLADLTADFGHRSAVLGVDLTGENHGVHRGKVKDLSAKTWPKAPFVLLILN